MSYLDERADLAGRVAVVVGGGGGIGRACAVTPPALPELLPA